MQFEFYSKFSSIVYHARVDHGYTQKEVAEAISVTVRWYQRVEKGEKFPGAIALLRLLLFLHIDIEELREEVGLVVPVRTVPRKALFR